MVFRLLTVLLLLFQVSISQGQKKALSIDDFKDWKSLENTNISANGKWVSYHLKPQKGNTRLVLHNLSNGSTDTLENIAESGFAFFNHFIVTTQVADYELMRSLKLKKEKKKDYPKDSLFVKDLKSGSYTFLDRVKSWKLPETNGQWLAYLKHQDPPIELDSTKVDTAAADAPKKETTKSDKDSYDLVLYHLSTGEKLSYPKVKHYSFSRNGSVCLFSSEDSATGKGVHVFYTSNKVSKLLKTDAEKYEGLCADTSGTKAAFLHTVSKKKDEEDDFSLSIFNLKTAQLITSIDSHKLQLRERISKHRKPSFTKNGQRIVFGIKYRTRDFPEDTTILDEEKAQLDIWSHHDSRLQPEQLKNLKKDQEKSREALYDFKKKKQLLLSDRIWARTVVNENFQGRFAMMFDSEPYGKQKSWESPWAKDIYLKDLVSGKQELFLSHFIGSASFSPGGKYLYWFDQSTSDWWIMSLKTRKKFSPSQTLGKIFHRADDDHPAKPSSYRIGGWLENDEKVFINDKYGFWSIDPTQKEKPLRLGGSKDDFEEWRIERTDYTLQYLPKTEGIRIRVFNKRTKDTYIKVWTNLTSASGLQSESQKAPYYKFFLQSKNRKVQLFKVSQSTVFPDIYIQKKDFVRLSDANPQQQRFKWYKTEIINYTSADGKPLQGILYSPESYDENKKYPVIVYFYEQLSDYVHGYQTPAPSRSTISRSFYCSNDYFVFVPDIVYQIGHPGKSAFNCIVPGVMKLIEDRPYLDKSKLALQGQSWGGYQTAYLITQTNLFTCAMAGAPVVNMTSAYGGIRWGSGLNRAFQYEHGQSRIGGTLWEKPIEYIENSPLFYANQVNTPLMMMHNDNDGAVPWYQGIEYFTALRRLGKPVWLLVYNGEQHNLTKYPNRIDLSNRMFGFFNHYLKGSHAPTWMTKGIPAIEKGKYQGY